VSVADQINYIKHRVYSSNEPMIQIEIGLQRMAHKQQMQ